jgi:hypothetical protein
MCAILWAVERRVTIWEVAVRSQGSVLDIAGGQGDVSADISSGLRILHTRGWL